ncbi:MAG TPA: hypothetical protein VJG90_00490 [Candidatus Nanoarchaeia archaeon]|nr:hypothetical protein [Candidatus Nanoarchaeia archaeon]
MHQPEVPKDGNPHSPRREHTVKFMLVITKTYSPSDTLLRVVSQNDGVPNAEVILIVETWLDQMKNRFKGNIGKAMTFDGEFSL